MFFRLFPYVGVVHPVCGNGHEFALGYEGTVGERHIPQTVASHGGTLDRLDALRLFHAAIEGLHLE